MAIEDYWASTARNAKDVAQYAIYPVVKMASLMAFKDSYRANLAAGIATSAFYTGLTEIFMGREMEGFDRMARKAVAAELGKNPDELKFSDYYDSKNVAVKKRMELFGQESKMRYPVSLMPMLPTVMEHVTRRISPQSMRPEHSSLAEGENRWRDKHPKPNAPAIEHFLDGWNVWDTAVYAGVAMLWLQETFNTEKTFAYQGRKEMEVSESLGMKLGVNNIMGLYNRARVDGGMEMIDDKVDRQKLWPMLEVVADKMNNSPEFGLPEAMYLMGLGKLDVFEKGTDGKEIKDKDGHRVIDQQAMQRAIAEINHVDKVGLKGIAEEKKKAGQEVTTGPKTWMDRVGRGWMDAHYNFQNAFGGSKKKFTEQISPRDPGETPISLNLN